MSLKAKIEEMNSMADSLHEASLKLNIRASELNGVAAVIPHDAPAPASYFKGCKVILHNVSYDHNAGRIRAVITLPYTADTDNNHSGGTYRINIDENWFE